MLGWIVTRFGHSCPYGWRMGIWFCNHASLNCGLLLVILVRIGLCEFGTECRGNGNSLGKCT